MSQNPNVPYFYPYPYAYPYRYPCPYPYPYPYPCPCPCPRPCPYPYAYILTLTLTLTLILTLTLTLTPTLTLNLNLNLNLNLTLTLTPGSVAVAVIAVDDAPTVVTSAWSAGVITRPVFLTGIFAVSDIDDVFYLLVTVRCEYGAVDVTGAAGEVVAVAASTLMGAEADPGAGAGARLGPSQAVSFLCLPGACTAALQFLRYSPGPYGRAADTVTLTTSSLWPASHPYPHPTCYPFRYPE